MGFWEIIKSLEGFFQDFSTSSLNRKKGLPEFFSTAGARGKPLPFFLSLFPFSPGPKPRRRPPTLPKISRKRSPLFSESFLEFAGRTLPPAVHCPPPPPPAAGPLTKPPPSPELSLWTLCGLPLFRSKTSCGKERKEEEEVEEKKRKEKGKRKRKEKGKRKKKRKEK